MITFQVDNQDGDRELRLDASDEVRLELVGELVGWVMQGRRMTDLHSSWTEWRFEPASETEPRGPIRRSIAEAYADARRYAHDRFTTHTTEQGSTA